MTGSSPTQTPVPDPNGAPAPLVWPALRYRDARAALRFLTEVLGFRAALVVPDDEGDITHAELRWPEGGAVMLGSSRHCDPAHAAMATGATSIYVVSDRVDELHARCAADGPPLGVEIVNSLEDTDYGSHTFGLRDHEGNLWTVGTYRGAP